MARIQSVDGNALSITSASSDFNLTTSSASTFAVWLYGTTSIAGGDFSNAPFGHVNAGGSDGWGIHSKLTGGTIYHVLYTFGGNSGQQNTGIGVDTWYHLAGIYDQGNNYIALYLNGAVLYENSSYTNDSAISTTTVYVGRSESGDSFKNWKGGLAEAAYWPNRRLTPDEIAALAHGFSPRLVQPNGLKLYLPLVADNASVIGPTLTEAGTATFEAHVPVIYPALPLIGLSSGGGGPAAQTANAALSVARGTDLSVTAQPGAVTANAGINTAQAVALSAAAQPGGISAGVDTSTARTVSPATTAQPGSISASIGTTAAQTVSPAVAVQPGAISVNVDTSSAQAVSPAVAAEATTIADVGTSSAQTVSPAISAQAGTVTTAVTVSSAQSASPDASAQPGAVSRAVALSIARTASPAVTPSEDTQTVGVNTSAAQTVSLTISAEPGTLSATVAASVARAISYGVSAGEDLQTVGVTTSIARAQSYATTAQPGGITAALGVSIARAVSPNATWREVLSPGLAGVSIHVDQAAGVVVVTQHDAGVTVTTTHAISIWIGAE